MHPIKYVKVCVYALHTCVYVSVYALHICVYVSVYALHMCACVKLCVYLATSSPGWATVHVYTHTHIYKTIHLTSKVSQKIAFSFQWLKMNSFVALNSCLWKLITYMCCRWNFSPIVSINWISYTKSDYNSNLCIRNL